MTKTRIHLATIPSYVGDGTQRKVLVPVPTGMPVLFAAGPIRNAPPWHYDAMRLVLAKDAPVFFVAPIRDIAVDLSEYIEKDNANYEVFPQQRALEQHYMYQAANPEDASGCIMFWLCGEQLPKEDPDKVYAHMTTFELAKWIERAKLVPGTRIVIGTDGKFPEFHTIEFEIATELGVDFPIYRTLEDTVDAALTLCGV